MKVLKRKLKKVHIVKRIFYFLTVLLFTASLIYFIMGILKLKGIETLIRSIVIAFFIVWLIIYIIGGLLCMVSKKNKTFIFLTIITLILCPIFTISSYYVNKVYGKISNINSNELLYTTNLIALKETNFTSDLPIGMIETESDIEGHILAKKLIEEEKLTNKIYTYEDYNSMISDLYSGKIGGCFVSSNYAVIFEGESFEEDEDSETKEVPLEERVKVLYDKSDVMENQDVITLTDSKDKKLTEPFTVLVMGVDSAVDGLKKNQAFNGDTLMLITFNPNTLTATMFSLPRDLYVPIACNHNRYAKINSSAAYGSSCVIKTVQQLTDIQIDYYVKINFTGVVQLVDALGGVTVDVEEPDFRYNMRIDCKGMVCEQNSRRQFGKNIIYVPTGIQKLNGEQALAYARNRHQYAISDIARNQHQQQIIEATAKKLKTINSITEVENILNSISNNIETNMTPEQIMSFYTVGKDMLVNSSGDSLSIKKTYLSYYNLGVWLRGPQRRTSALGYYPESLEAIKKLMKVNLELEKEEPTKTFSISYNEDYTTPLVGYGLSGGGRLALVKSFAGATELEATEWCESVNISCTFETKTDYHTAGLIIDQDAHEGELVLSLNKITFYISDGLGEPPVEENPDEENTDTPTEDENGENIEGETNPDEGTTEEEGTESTEENNNSTEITNPPVVNPPEATPGL